ncbi:hypothetical protein SAMN05216598_1551 [Pseudomonas asplenii]|uniref:Uncharacterized protein n=1 Tax=Pseudomonas asplenii TaxID=53407 RepID=A0A1H1S5L7_9PSED|nr:hypothetical protein [Pseudomonas asplenii]SDS42529.1 hypothetical protein SAMN05216598_1551 [Pseudomonas asplenii]
MINQKVHANPKLDLPEQAKVGDVLTLTGPIVNVFSGLYQLHFHKGGSDAAVVTGFNILSWDTLAFTVPNKVGKVTVSGIYATLTSLPEEVQFSAPLTIEPA